MTSTVVNIDSSLVRLTGNPALERNVKEEKDKGNLIVTSTRTFRYEPYSKVDITTPYGDEEQYLVQADNPIKLNATDYEHNLTLVENIAFFDEIFTADRSFKILGQTLEDILTAYKRELEAYHNILITWTTIPQAVLDETIPFKEFSGVNFASILLSLFRKLWAVPKVNRVGNNWNIYPQYISNKNSLITSDSISETYQQNNVDYATKIKSQLKNAVNERTEVKWFPSENGYVLPRSSTLIKQESKLRYELDSKIISIIEARAVEVHFLANNIITGIDDNVYINVDLSNYVIQDEAWDLLPTITGTTPAAIAASSNTRNHIRYKVGQPYLSNLFESGTDKLVFSHDTEYLINAIFRETNINRATYFLYPYDSGLPVMQTLVTEDVKMRFRYVRQRDMDIVHSRKTKGDMNETTTIHQQRDSSVEVNEYIKNLKLYSNRMGNNTYSKTQIFEYPDIPHKLFDFIDNKRIVTRVQNTYHNTYVYCEYEESDDFSNIEAEYALMRRSDPYTINAKAVTTNLVIQESMEFSSQARTLDTRLTSDARRLLGGLFEATTVGIDKAAVGVFKPVLASWNSLYSIHMPVEPSGDGNLIALHVQFPHQTIAGKTYYDLDTDTYNSNLNPLPYTKVSDPPEIDDGTLTNYELYFTPDVLIEDLGEYPLILDETAYLANNLTVNNSVEPIDLDAAASLAVTFEVNITADENIFIGNKLASENYFIKDQATSTAIAIYKSTKPYGQYDQVPRTTDTDVTATVAYTYSYANRTITITPTSDINYFSIVKDGYIMLAVNQFIAAGTSYVINRNHIGSNVTIINSSNSAIGVSLVEGTYLLKLAQLSSSSISAVGSVDTTYLLKLAQVSSSNIIATGTVTTTYSTILNQGANISVVAVGLVSGSYSQTDNIKLNTTIDVDATVSTSYTVVQAQALNTDIIVSVAIGTTYTQQNYEWVETATTTPIGDGTCDEYNDIGTIKIVAEPTCVYNETSTYPSATDETTTIPACSAGAEYTLCFFDKNLLVWVCTDYLGAIEDQDVYYECQLN